MPPVLHFVGFRDDAFLCALRIFGRPDFIHRQWDARAVADIAPGDTVIVATGDDTQPLARASWDDSSFFVGPDGRRWNVGDDNAPFPPDD